MTDWLQPENRFKATPMDLLRQGIVQRQWEAVEACYLSLTGEKLSDAEVSRKDVQPEPKPATATEIAPVCRDEPPKRKRGRPRKNPLPEPEQATVIIPEDATAIPLDKVPDSPVPGVDPMFANCVAPAKGVGKDGKSKIYTRATTHDCRPHPNTWKDDGQEAADEIVKNRTVPQTILNAKRPPTRNIRVRCQGCGKVEDIDPSLVPYGLRLTSKYTMRYLCNSCIVGAKSGIEAETFSGEEALFDEELAE